MVAAPQLSTLGRYTAIASLGQGGMANIYLAVMSGPQRFNKLLVLKVLREDLETSAEDMVAMFLDEARLAARLHHRNIVHTYEFGQADGRHFIAMEYLEGQPLRTVQRRLGRDALPLAEELRILAETARGLHYAHDLTGFDGAPLAAVHRDVSPHNVMVTYDGQVKLLDFGIAKTAASEHLTKVGVIKGKVDYIAPEQVRGEKVDRRADVFALGAMLYEAISGERFAGGAKVPDVTKIHNRLQGAEPKLRALRPDVSDVLASIVDDALALSPAARIASAGSFADRLESYLATLPAQPSAKSLAALVAPRFEDERTKMRRAIERQLQRLAETEVVRARPSLVAPGGDYGLTESGFVDLGTTASDAAVAPTGYAIATLQDAAPPGPRARIGTALAVAAVGVLAVLVTRGEATAPQASAAEPPATIATQAPVETVEPPAVVVEKREQAAAAQKHEAREPAAVIAPPTRTEPSTVAAAPARESARKDGASRAKEREVASVRLAIHVTPAHARVTLDGEPLPSPPFEVAIPKSSAVRRMEVTADGHERAKRLLVLDRDRQLDLALRPTPQPREKSPRTEKADRPANADKATRAEKRTRPERAEKKRRTRAPIEAAPKLEAPVAKPATATEQRAPKTERPARPKPGGFDMNDPYAD